MNCKCLYCGTDMNRTENPTPYGLFKGYKCPRCDFAFSGRDGDPNGPTIYFPDEQKLESIRLKKGN